MLRVLWFLPVAAQLACVPEDPPDFRRDLTGTRTAQASRTPTAKTRTTTRNEPGTARLLTADAELSSANPLTQPFRDNFERAELGTDWKLTSGAWHIEHGALCVSAARNHPAWLTRRLPTNARIEFDATSNSPDGDLKAEAWGDGRSYATSASYSNATSYIVIFGGWKNSLHVLARLDEHKRDRLELKVDPESDDSRQHPVSEGQTYHFKIERRDGATVRWSIDDAELHAFEDDEPLLGPGHEHFAFNNWQAPVCFDNLNVVPLEG